MKSEMGIIVRRALEADLESLVAIHIDAFPGFFLTKMGRVFLKRYYYGYLEMQETLLVAVGGDNRVIGFVAGLKDSEGYYLNMKKHCYRFVFPVILAAVNFDLLVTVIRRILSILRSNKVNEEQCAPDGFHELTSIAVLPVFRKVGAGKLLMLTYLDAIKAVEGTKGVFLTTDSDKNASVIRFYKSMGFQAIGEFAQGSKRIMRAYSLEFE